MASDCLAVKPLFLPSSWRSNLVCMLLYRALLIILLLLALWRVRWAYAAFVIAGARARSAHRLEVRYDRDLGYPAWLVIDYDRAIADDEFTYSVMAFRRR